MPRDRKRSAIDDRVRIEHMLVAARQAAEFVAGRARADLDTDLMLQHALSSVVQQIGEAAANISDQARARVTDLPWGQIVAMRNVLVHVYWGVDLDRLWATAVEDVPVLIAALEKACSSWPLAEPDSGDDEPAPSRG